MHARTFPFLAAVVATTPAAAQDDPASPEPVVSADAAPPTPPVDDDAPNDTEPPRVHAHGMGLGYRGFVMSATDGSRYFLTGPSASYSYFVGRSWGFLIAGEGSALIRGRYETTGRSFNQPLSAYYDERRFAFDGYFLAARRRTFGDSLALTVGVGAHVQGFVLRGVKYLPVDGISGGIGAMAKFEYLVNRVFSVQATGAVALDAIDFVRHENPALLSAPMSLTLGVGLRR